MNVFDAYARVVSLLEAGFLSASAGPFVALAVVGCEEAAFRGPIAAVAAPPGRRRGGTAGPRPVPEAPGQGVIVTVADVQAMTLPVHADS